MSFFKKYIYRLFLKNYTTKYKFIHKGRSTRLNIMYCRMGYYTHVWKASQLDCIVLINYKKKQTHFIQPLNALKMHLKITFSTFARILPKTDAAIFVDFVTSGILSTCVCFVYILCREWSRKWFEVVIVTAQSQNYISKICEFVKLKSILEHSL